MGRQIRRGWSLWRWTGRIVQPQNPPRTYIVVFGSVPDTLSQPICTAFVSVPSCNLVDADFLAIEAHVIAWLAKSGC